MNQLSLVNPNPQVDPYWEPTDAKVHKDVFDAVENPRTGDEFVDAAMIRSTVNVARYVAATRTNNWHAVRQLGDDLGQRFAVEWQRVNNIDPLNTANPKAIATYVHDDKPAHAPQKVCAYLKARGAKRIIYNQLPNVANFHRGEIAEDALCGMMAHEVNATAFALKYYHKVPRPHRIAADMLSGAIEAEACDVEALKVALPEAAEKDFEAFTLIRAATPNHWAYPAMHSTLAGALPLIGAALYDHAPASVQALEIKRYAYAIGMGRTMLGVHHLPDNVAGLRAGQAIGLKVIPGIMAKLADADPSDVLQRIAPFEVDF